LASSRLIDRALHCKAPRTVACDLVFGGSGRPFRAGGALDFALTPISNRFLMHEALSRRKA
jgi:hypothetical protein